MGTNTFYIIMGLVKRWKESVLHIGVIRPNWSLRKWSRQDNIEECFTLKSLQHGIRWGGFWNDNDARNKVVGTRKMYGSRRMQQRNINPGRVVGGRAAKGTPRGRARALYWSCVGNGRNEPSITLYTCP